MPIKVQPLNSEFSGCTFIGTEMVTECRVTPTFQAGKVLGMVKHHTPSGLVVGPLLVPPNLFPKVIFPALFLIPCRRVLA